MQTSTDVRTVASQYLEAWNTKNFELMDQVFHPDMVWHAAITPYDESVVSPLQSNLLKGRPTWSKSKNNKKDTIETFRLTLQNIPDFKIEIQSIIVDGDRVAVEAVGSATHPGNGRKYDNLYCYVLEIKDGQIILLREYQDTLLVFDVWFAE